MIEGSDSKSDNTIKDKIITKVKASGQLRYNKMEVFVNSLENKSDISDIYESFLHFVWSFNYDHHSKNEDFFEYDSTKVGDFVYRALQAHSDEFFHCLYLLDIGFEDLAPLAQKQIKNDDYKKEWSDKYPDQYSIVHKPWRNSIASKIFYNPKKPLDVEIFVWLNKNGYFAKHDEIVFYESYGGNPKTSSSKLLPFDEFESICEKRKTDRIGNYKFKTFDEFKSFVGLDEDGDQYKEGYYPKVAVSVKSLSDVLKKENKFLTSDKFIKLVKRENIFFDKPENLTEDDIEEWNDYKDFVNRSGMMSEKEKTKRHEARKKYWEYIKCILFGNSGKNIRGLLDIRNLSETDLKSISDCLSNKFEFFTGIKLFCDDKDVFNNSDNKYKQYIADDLKTTYGLFLPVKKSVVSSNSKNQIELNKKQETVTTDLSRPKGKMGKIVVGIILLLIGIIGCGTVLGLGLTGKLAIISLLFFITMTAIGFVCLIWKQISRCLVPCCPSLSGPSTQKNSLEKNKNREQDRNLNLTANDKKKTK